MCRCSEVESHSLTTILRKLRNHDKDQRQTRFLNQSSVYARKCVQDCYYLTTMSPENQSAASNLLVRKWLEVPGTPHSSNKTCVILASSSLPPWHAPAQDTGSHRWAHASSERRHPDLHIHTNMPRTRMLRAYHGHVVNGEFLFFIIFWFKIYRNITHAAGQWAGDTNRR